MYGVLRGLLATTTDGRLVFDVHYGGNGLPLCHSDRLDKEERNHGQR